MTIEGLTFESLSYLYVFLQSNALELPIYVLGLIKMTQRSWASLIGSLSMINLWTHPIVFFVLMPLQFNYLSNILMAESFAIGAEAGFLVWLFRVSISRGLTLSFVANFFSWQLAPVSTYFLFY